MDELGRAINRQYGSANLGERILSALEAGGHDLDSLTIDDLAGIDQMHFGGKQGTLALAELADLRPGAHVIDIGSGLGGSARTLASEYEATVLGIDLTEDFVSAARMLTDRLGMTDWVTFRHGSALDLPVEDASFEVAWSQNTVMNIEDKVRLFAEIHRVLRPAGLLVLEAMLAGPNEGLEYPLLWADTPGVSFLVDAAELRTLLSNSGFEQVAWQDVTPRRSAGDRGRRPSPLVGIDTVYEQVPAKRANVWSGIEKGQLTSVYTVQRRSP